MFVEYNLWTNSYRPSSHNTFADKVVSPELYVPAEEIKGFKNIYIRVKINFLILRFSTLAV